MNNNSDISKDQVLKAAIGKIDLLLLFIMWLIIFGESIVFVGAWLVYFYAFLNMILVLRKTSNGILVMLLIFYTPATALVGLPVGAFTLAVIILAVKFFLIDLLLKNKSINFNKIFYATVIFIVYVTFSVLYSPNIDMALIQYRKYIEGLVVLMLFFATISNLNDLGRVYKFWVVSAAFSLFIKLTHIHFGIDTALFKLLRDVDVGSRVDLAHRLTVKVGRDFANRILWPGQEPNYLSADLIYPFAISLGLFSANRSWNKLFWLILAGMISVSVIGTYSRSGFISIVSVLFIFIILGNKRAIIPSVFVGAVLLAVVISIPQLHDRIFSIEKEVSGSGSGRFYLWKTALDMWLSSPIIGNGLYAYYESHGAAHNTYLQLLAETGLIGTLLFLSVVLIAIGYNLKTKRNYADSKAPDVVFAKIILTGLIGMSLMMNTISYQDIKLYWLCCASTAAIFFITYKLNKNNTKLSIS